MPIKKMPAGVLVISLLSTTGCGYLFGDEGMFRDRSEDYKKAPEMPVVAAPQDGQVKDFQEIYVIPQVQEKFLLDGEFEVPRPAPLVTGGGSDIVRIQKLGEDSWALIAVAPGQVWPQVRSFMDAAGMQVARVDARAGILDSNWFNLEERSLASRFRFRLEQGVQRGTSELHVLQMTQGKGESDWPRASDDAQQESDMLHAVAQFLADSADTAPVSMIAEQGISAGGKITMQEAIEGYTYIRLELAYDRAWASLGRALEKSTFEITDRDRSSGMYYTLFVGPQEGEEAGWMDWLWDSDEAHPMAGQKFLVTMAAESDAAVTIQLRPQEEDKNFEKREEQGLLALIKGNIN